MNSESQSDVPQKSLIVETLRVFESLQNTPDRQKKARTRAGDGITVTSPAVISINEFAATFLQWANATGSVAAKRFFSGAVMCSSEFYDNLIGLIVKEMRKHVERLGTSSRSTSGGSSSTSRAAASAAGGGGASSVLGPSRTSASVDADLHTASSAPPVDADAFSVARDAAEAFRARLNTDTYKVLGCEGCGHARLPPGDVDGAAKNHSLHVTFPDSVSDPAFAANSYCHWERHKCRSVLVSLNFDGDLAKVPARRAEMSAKHGFPLERLIDARFADEKMEVSSRHALCT